MKLLLLCCILIVQSLWAQKPIVSSGGGHEGGGGDPLEARVDEIRADIFKWISAGGAKKLKLPDFLTLKDYELKMIKVLAPMVVRITFIEKDHESDEELQLNVSDKPKTCRSFRSKKDYSLNILCHISRFALAKEADQYRLIHHEYAGLARVERNEGSKSDYFISNQLTDFLEFKKVLRLAIKGSSFISEPNCNQVVQYLKKGRYSLIYLNSGNQHASYIIRRNMNKAFNIYEAQSKFEKSVMKIPWENLTGGYDVIGMGGRYTAVDGNLEFISFHQIDGSDGSRCYFKDFGGPGNQTYANGGRGVLFDVVGINTSTFSLQLMWQGSLYEFRKMENKDIPKGW